MAMAQKIDHSSRGGRKESGSNLIFSLFALIAQDSGRQSYHSAHGQGALLSLAPGVHRKNASMLAVVDPFKVLPSGQAPPSSGILGTGHLGMPTIKLPLLDDLYNRHPLRTRRQRKGVGSQGNYLVLSAFERAAPALEVSIIVCRTSRS